MSRNQQKKQHTDRRSGQKKNERFPKNSKNVVRVRLVDGLYVFYTTSILLVAVACMVFMQYKGWLDGIMGGILAIGVGGVAVTMLIDLALLLTACVKVADGVVMAGKNDRGEVMVFHTENILRVELRDKSGNTVEENRRRYAKVAVTFVMASGRLNQRPLGHIRQRQLDSIRHAVGK